MRIPKYRKHSVRDFGFVEWEGTRHRLPGVFDSPESLKAYEAFVRNLSSSGPAVNQAVTIEVLASAYLDYAQAHYKTKFRTTAYHHLLPLLRRLMEFARHDLATDFGPKRLKEFREILIAAGHARGTINQEMGHIKRMFRYGVAEELVPSSAWEALRSLPALSPGRTKAREPSPRMPASWAAVEKTLAKLTPQLGAMVQAQWWIGCRSEAIVLAQLKEFDTSGEVWLWRPRHKMEYRHSLILAVGPKAQAFLRPYMDDSPYVFSPRRDRRSKRYRDHFDSQTYRNAVVRATKKAGVPHWTPHQLRHARATAIRERFGIEAAQAVIGHENLSTTEVYAARSLDLAKRIALELG